MLFQPLEGDKICEQCAASDRIKLTRGINLSYASYGQMMAVAGTPGPRPKAPGFKGHKAFSRDAVKFLLQDEDQSALIDPRIELLNKVRHVAMRVVEQAYNLPGFSGRTYISLLYFTYYIRAD